MAQTIDIAALNQRYAAMATTDVIADVSETLIKYRIAAFTLAVTANRNGVDAACHAPIATRVSNSPKTPQYAAFI